MSSPKVIFTTDRPTSRQIEACAPFGLHLRAGAAPLADWREPAAHVRTALLAGQIALLTGPSGCGKSRTLHALTEHLRRRSRVVIVSHSESPRTDPLLIDILGHDLPPERVMAHLARFGLAEPALLARRLGELSEGQRHRALLAAGFWRAERVGADWLLIDEFCSVLDRVTAEGVAHTFARAARATRVRVVVATAHHDLARRLAPDLHLQFDALGSWRPCGPTSPAPDPIIIEPGSKRDLERLIDHHYLAGPPATRVGYLRAVDELHDQLAGVLVISMPTLNGVWRAQAWPGRYSACSRRAASARLNAEVRCISRVIVDPRYRGRGVARRLVDKYLRDPQTPATEAVAAMGSICPLFERAGMTGYRLPRHPADARLADALESEGHEAWMLADADRAADLLRRPLLARELERWSRCRHLQNAQPDERARLAGARLCVTPMAYAHVFPPSTASNRRKGEPDEVR
ncbi:MAG: GNAT family N-acetyltransferase [Leptolyngbya sp. PLA3]|nr:MAG: GNAT family N-acetyltransferase [Cyanobacteria bacterium CYA]MCE7968483.1 GNAT family N-acetyltransferase [Leptolyngbya sp. PL-A3]